MKIAVTTISIVVFLLLVVTLGVSSASLLDALETALNSDGMAYELNVDQNDNLIVSDYWADEIWQIDPATNVYTIYHGASSATDAQVDSAGNFWWTGNCLAAAYKIADRESN